LKIQEHVGITNRLLYQLSYVGFVFAFFSLPNRLAVFAVQVLYRRTETQAEPEDASGWMFPKIGSAVRWDLDNLADRVIKPRFKANGFKWKGWYAYRRGLATNLHELGVPDIVIRATLRHADIRTTQPSYIKTVPQVVTAAMKRLEVIRTSPTGSADTK
jgi:hypothetical protein